MLPQTSASLYTYFCSLGSVLEELVQQLLRSLSNVNEMNAYTAVKYVCVCVCVCVCAPACFNLRDAGRILTKFDMGVMLLEATPNVYLLISKTR
jgi:hypothetical protein